MTKRKVFIGVFSCLALAALICSLVFGILPSLRASAEEELPVQVTYLGETEYIVSDGSGSSRGSVNENALGKGNIVLGPAVAQRRFEKGVSLLTISETQAATLTVPVSQNADFDLFTTDFGVDAANGSTSASARFQFYVDGVLLEEKTVKGSDFHSKFEISLRDVREIKICVFGKKGTCVSFGDAAFYKSSTNAVSMRVENAVYGAWPVPVQRNANLYGGDLKIGSTEYKYGFCINSVSSFELVIDGDYRWFSAYVGIDEAVAGGSSAGSVCIQALAIDEDGNVLRSVRTPVLYGYMEQYKLLLNTSGAARIRFSIEDGGDGIADDMAVIGSPAFSMTLGKSAAYLGDFPLLSSSVGEGTLGIDRTASGGALDYTRGTESLSFEKGVGFSLKNASYQKYLANPDNPENYAYADFDISSSNAEFFEGLLVMRSGEGAYAEIYADGELLTKAVELVPLDKGGAPLRVSSLLPENAANLEVRLIAKSENAGGEAEFVNARLYGDDAAFGGFAVSETLCENYPYPFGRDVTPLGNEVRILSKTGAKGVASSISLFANSSVSFGITDKEADTFSAVIGLQEGYNGTLTFKVTAVFADGSRSVYTSPEISAENSYLEIAWYAGKNIDKILLEVEGDQGCVGVFGDNLLFKSGYGDKERISELEWSGAESGWGTVNVDKDVMGYPININGTTYEKGISMHAFQQADKYAYVQVNIPEGLGYTLFASRIGVSKDTSNGGTAGSVKFYVEGDGKVLYASNLVRVSDDAQFILVDITGISQLKLMVDNGDGSYECDFAAWVDPVIAKTTSVLDDYLKLDSPIANQSVAATGNNMFTVSGTLLGAETEAEIRLNGVSVGKATAGEYGKFSKEISVASAGRNVIRVTAGSLTEELSIFVADNAVSPSTYTLESYSTSVTLRPAANGILIEDISRTGGYGWLKDSSFVRFPDEVRLGGKDGEPFSLVWNFQGAEYKEEDTVSKNINVFKEDYIGKTKSYIFSYTDASGKFSLESVWSTQSDFAAPVSHKINLFNQSGVTVYVSTADTLTMSLINPNDSELTASYSYKGAIYETSYGYRCDKVSDGYNMNVFSSTDYNNGYQEDAGFIPWVSLNADGKEGLNIGIAWSDCRAHIYGTGNDSVYIEAGLRPRFETEIPAGETFYIPESFVDAYAGSVDNGSNQLKKWLFAFNMPEVNRLDDSLPSFEFNLWELLDEERRSWRMSDSKFYTGVHQLAEMGIGEITIDTYWWKDIGDWRGVHEKWQSSITYSSNFVNALGMNFSLYMQAGNGGSLHTDAMTGSGINGNPNWFARGQNVFWDELCIADSDARAFLSDYLKHYFMELGLDGLRTDFSYILGYCSKEDHAHIDSRADVGYWTSLYVYQLFAEMYELFPVPSDVNADSEVHYFKWENCNCGGTLKDFASMKYATRIQTTDAYDPINVRRSFYDASYVFPSMQLMLWMNDYMYNGDGPYPNDNYRFWSTLMGAPCPMISMPSDMSPETYASLVNTISIYRNWMQELVKYGDVYHILPRADGIHWDGVQYFNPDTGKGAVLAFKPDPDGSVDDTVTLCFDGVSDTAVYYVWSEEGYIPFATYTGAQLKNGIDLTIEDSYGAEIVYFMDVTAEGAEETVAAPKAFSAQTQPGDGRLEITLGLCENADYYVFALENAGKTVYSFIADEFSAESNVLEGLSAGVYKLTVTAYNRFGTRTQEYDVEIETSSAFADAGYVVSGADGGEIVIDGARYIKGQSLDLSDGKFGEAAFRSIGITNLGERTALNIRTALAAGDEAECVEICVWGVRDGTKELLKTMTVSAADSFCDISVNIAGYTSLKITAENTSPDVYTQTAVGYGRTGLYGGAPSDHYDFSFDVQVLRNGLNETFPRAGGFAAYVDDDNFAALYLDAYYSNIVIYERVGGQQSDKTYKIKMAEGFDYSAKHTLRAVRSGESISYFVDGELIAEHTLKLAPSKVALITEDAQARFSNVVRRLGDRVEEISWRTYHVGVNIYGKTIYSTKVTEGVWERVKPRLQLVLY